MCWLSLDCRSGIIQLNTSSPTSSHPFFVYAVSEHKKTVSMHGICRTPLTFRFRVTRLVSLLGGALLLEGGVEVVAGNGTGHVVSVPVFLLDEIIPKLTDAQICGSERAGGQSYQKRLPIVAPMPIFLSQRISHQTSQFVPSVQARLCRWQSRCRRIFEGFRESREKRTKGNGQVSDEALLEHLHFDVSNPVNSARAGAGSQPPGNIRQ
jgi:hypothetical protein